MTDSVAIVDGGIGGLAAALALVRHHINLDVYKRAPELREFGAGARSMPASALFAVPW
jgi:salicylate hydroxylase